MVRMGSNGVVVLRANVPARCSTAPHVARRVLDVPHARACASCAVGAMREAQVVHLVTGTRERRRRRHRASARPAAWRATCWCEYPNSDVAFDVDREMLRVRALEVVIRLLAATSSIAARRAAQRGCTSRRRRVTHVRSTDLVPKVHAGRVSRFRASSLRSASVIESAVHGGHDAADERAARHAARGARERRSTSTAVRRSKLAIDVRGVAVACLLAVGERRERSDGPAADLARELRGAEDRGGRRGRRPRRWGHRATAARPMRRAIEELPAARVPPAEVEDLAALEEERALLLKERLVHAEVHDGRVDFDLAEVGIDRRVEREVASATR